MMATLLSLFGIEEGMFENEGHQLINSSALMVHIFLSLLAIDRFSSGMKHAFAMGVYSHDVYCTYNIQDCTSSVWKVEGSSNSLKVSTGVH